MAENTSFPFSIGQTSTLSTYNSTLGQESVREVAAGKQTFVLVKAASAITLPQNRVVVSALSAAGVPTWIVDVTTTAGAGPALIIPPEYSTTTIASGAVFWAQLRGPALGISAGAIALYALVGTSTTAGKIDDATITGGSIGYATLVAAGVDITVGVFLR